MDRRKNVFVLVKGRRHVIVLVNGIKDESERIEGRRKKGREEGASR